MTLDLSKYLSVDQQVQPEKTTQDQPLNLDKFLSVDEATPFDEFKRHVARTGSRIGETIAGFPGDFVKFVNFLGDKLPEVKVPGQENNPLLSLGKKGLESLPTSQDLREISEQYTKGYTKAQGPKEELSDEIFSLASALALPAKNPVQLTGFLTALGKNLPMSFAKAAAVKGAGKGAEELGAGPKTKAAAELGMLFLTGMLGKKTAKEYVSEKYQQARSAIPEGDILPTNKFLSGLEKVEQELSKGVSTPTKNEVLAPLKELKAKASGGGMLVEDLVQSYHDINERLNAKKLFDELSKGERQLLRNRYDTLRDEIRNTIQDYGKDNPAFLKQWQEANQGYATLAQSNKVTDFFGKHKSKIPSHLLTTVVAELFLGHPYIAAGTAGAAVGGGALLKSGELIYKISKSPMLRRHYLNVINEASKENLPGVVKNLEILDKELNK